ncbi:MAG: transposase [Spirochaetaceae bacterium]|nr:transposase [Spirochaetaceae bacterium]
MKIREIFPDPVLRYHVNYLVDCLEFEEAVAESLKERILVYAELFMSQIEILTGMKGGRKPRFLSVFIAIAIIADIIDVSRFNDPKHFTSYLRSAPRVSNSNTSTSIKGTNKKGRKLPATL